MHFSRLSIIIICFVLKTDFPYAGSLFVPSQPDIRYTGRIDKHNPYNYRFDWPNVSIEASFEGTSCDILMHGAGESFNIFIDDTLVKILKTDSGQVNTYNLVSGLKDTVHKLLITKRYVRKGAVSQFRGIILDNGKKLLPLTVNPQYRIEFIGASTLNGFGNESKILRCVSETIPDLSNCYYSYGPVAARLLNAESAVIAISSKGIVRNWASPFIRSAETYSEFFTRTLLNEPEITWEFNRWIPHVVVVNLGTNDFSTRPHPPSTLFINNYWSFLQFIYQIYPDVDIVCMATDKEPLKSLIYNLVEKEKALGNTRIHFFSYDPIPVYERGCDWHPGIIAHRKIAIKLADMIKPILEKK